MFLFFLRNPKENWQSRNTSIKHTSEHLQIKYYSFNSSTLWSFQEYMYSFTFDYTHVTHLICVIYTHVCNNFIGRYVARKEYLYHQQKKWGNIHAYIIFYIFCGKKDANIPFRKMIPNLTQLLFNFPQPYRARLYPQ